MFINLSAISHDLSCGTTSEKNDGIALKSSLFAGWTHTHQTGTVATLDIYWRFMQTLILTFLEAEEATLFAQVYFLVMTYPQPIQKDDGN